MLNHAGSVDQSLPGNWIKKFYEEAVKGEWNTSGDWWVLPYEREGTVFRFPSA